MGAVPIALPPTRPIVPIEDERKCIAEEAQLEQEPKQVAEQTRLNAERKQHAEVATLAGAGGKAGKAQAELPTRRSR